MTPPSTPIAPAAPKTVASRHSTPRQSTAPSFIETRKWVAEVAEREGVKMSRRRAEAVAEAYRIECEVWDDGEQLPTISFRDDPTGNTAVARVLYLITHY